MAFKRFLSRCGGLASELRKLRGEVKQVSELTNEIKNLNSELRKLTTEVPTLMSELPKIRRAVTRKEVEKGFAICAYIIGHIEFLIILKKEDFLPDHETLPRLERAATAFAKGAASHTQFTFPLANPYTDDYCQPWYQD